MPTNEKTSPVLPPPDFDLGNGWFVLPDGTMYGRRTVLVLPQEAEAAGAIVNRAAERVRAAAPEMLELLKKAWQEVTSYKTADEIKALLKRIDGDQP